MRLLVQEERMWLVDAAAQKWRENNRAVMKKLQRERQHLDAKLQQLRQTTNTE